MSYREKLEKEYLEQYPTEESPFQWRFIVNVTEIIEFLENRKGRKVLLSEQIDGALDGQALIYG